MRREGKNWEEGSEGESKEVEWEKEGAMGRKQGTEEGVGRTYRQEERLRTEWTWKVFSLG